MNHRNLVTPIFSVLILVLTMASKPAFAGSLFSPPKKPIPPALFCLNLINKGKNWPSVPFHGWRTLHSNWWTIEPERGLWNFGSLDAEIALAEQNRVEPVLFLEFSPNWASSRPNDPPFGHGSLAPAGFNAPAKYVNEWRHYVRTVASRYRGRVRTYELWNEPNVKRFYTGSIEQLVELNQVAYTELKKIDPGITVVSSSLSPCCNSLAYFDQYLALGGGNYADVIGYHFYCAPDVPESMVAKIRQVQGLMEKHGVGHKPLWNTETGWNIFNHDVNVDYERWAGPPLEDRTASAFIARSYLISWAAGVERLYWYAWGHKSMGLTEYDGRTPKAPALAFKEIQDWLIGSRMQSLDELNGVFICRLNYATNKNAWVVWSPNNIVYFNIPAEWNVRRMRHLSGKAQTLTQSHIEVGPEPIYLEGSKL